MFRHKLLQTGLPFLTLVLFLVAAIIYFESELLSQSENIAEITIAPNMDDSFDIDSVTGNPVVKPQYIQDIIQQLLSEDDPFATIKHNNTYQTLSDTDKSLVYNGVSQQLIARHNYAKLLSGLKNIPLSERLKHKVQFSYAFALSKGADPQLAIEQYQALIKHEQNSQSGHLNLGLLLKKEKQCNDAIPVFLSTASITSGTKKAKALSALASCYKQLGQFDKAVAHYKKSIEYRPNASHVWIMLASTLAETSADLHSVLDTFDKGLALNPQDYKAHLLKAKYQMAHYDFSGAINTLDTALSLSNNTHAHELMAWAYLELGKRVRAKKYLSYVSKHSTSKKQKRRAEYLLLYTSKQYQKLLPLLKKKRLSEDMRYLKGLTYRRLFFYSNAFSTFNKLSDSKAFHWRIQIHQARMTRARKQYEAAEKLYEALLVHNNKAAFLWFESALISEALNQAETGLVKIENAIELRPKNNTYKLAQARLLKMAGESDQAITVVENILKKKPNYIRALNLLANLFQEKNDINQLLATYEKILSIKTDDYITMLKLAQTLIQNQEHQRAQTILQTLLQEQSNNIEARYLLAESYFQTQQFKESLTEIDQLLRLEKNYQQAIALKDKLSTII